MLTAMGRPSMPYALAQMSSLRPARLWSFIPSYAIIVLVQLAGTSMQVGFQNDDQHEEAQSS